MAFFCARILSTMNRLYFLLSSSLLFLTACTAQVQNIVDGGSIKAKENSLLWKIEGKGIQPSYVFGTFHLLPQADFNMKQHVKQAMISCDQLVLELDMDDPQMQMDMMSNMNMQDSVKLSSLLNEEEYQLVKDRLFAATKMPLEMMDSYKPFFVATMLQYDFIQGDVASFEGSFVQLAIEHQKEILGLETVGEQMSIFDSIPYQQQADDLVEMLKEDKDMSALFDEMIEVYKQEDIEALDRSMHEEMDDPLQFNLLITDRNKRWVPRIAEVAAEKSSFIGVGAGHLGGEFGLIQLLMDAGFEVTPVQTN